MCFLYFLTIRAGSRKLAAAHEALAKFASDIHPSSEVVPVQLDITDDASIKNAHASITKKLEERNLAGLDVLINKCVPVPALIAPRV